MSGADGFGGRGGDRVRGDLDHDLAAALTALAQETERTRLAIFREQAARTVRLASPLLLDACAPGEVDGAAWRLRPSRLWPRPITVQTLVRVRIAEAMEGRRLARISRAEGRLFLKESVVLSLNHRTAHLVLRSGAVSLVTSDEGGRLALPGVVSDPDGRPFVGGPLERAFEHPATARGDYVVTAADIDRRRARTVLTFDAPPIEWRVPWARPGWRG